MRHFLNSLFILILSAALFSCRQDDPDSPIGPEASDNFVGSHDEFSLSEEAAKIPLDNIRIILLAPDGSEITRDAIHRRSAGRSSFRLHQGLKEGIYRLQATTGKPTDSDGNPVEYGLGSRIEVSEEGISVIDSFNPNLGYAGKGTKENPYIVSSSSHLTQLMLTVNDYDDNKAVKEDTYFLQTRDLDMKSASRNCDMAYGWLPIGADTNTPFRGVYMAEGHSISNLMINRPSSPGIGLFGYVCNATFDGIILTDCSVNGQFAVSALAGAVVTSSKSRGQVVINDCSAVRCEISGNETSMHLGSLLGGTDMHSMALLSNCTTTDGSLSGGYNVGGLTGGAGRFSSIMLSNCANNGSMVTAAFSGAGGLIGTADTLQVAGCRNLAPVYGATGFSNQPGQSGIATGGIAGGAGMCWISASVNNGAVYGKDGTGGILGSTRVKGSDSEAYVFNPAMLRYCSNTGEVRGNNFVGGIVGEAQVGAYAACNSANVSGIEFTGGIAGNTSVAVVHNSVNGGDISGKAQVGGIVGKTTWGSVAICHNIGKVKAASGRAGGITALSGNNTMVHYCGNFGAVSTDGDAPCGGIIGEVGDPREWTGAAIAECVVGSLECVMAVAGPLCAVVEGAFELAHGVEIALKLSEISAETLLQGADYALLGYGVYEILEEEEAEAISAAMHDVSENFSQEVNDAIASLRAGAAPDCGAFVSSPLSDSYFGRVDKLISLYATEGNDEKFNHALNEAREERGEKLEKAAKSDEIIHAVVAGVAVAASTVALIGSTVATGGVAAGFVLMGSTAAVVGGANAITKACTEFECNACIISQCVNSASVTAPHSSDRAPMVGRLNDGGLIHDCLNTSPSAPAVMMASRIGQHCDIRQCVSLPYVSNINGAVAHCAASAAKPSDAWKYQGGVLYVDGDAWADPSTFSKIYMEIGDDKLWTIPEGCYPVPARSEFMPL